MKLCKDCKHYRPLEYKWLFFKMKGPENLSKCAETLEPIAGEPAEFCEFKRKATGTCGPDGKKWTN